MYVSQRSNYRQRSKRQKLITMAIVFCAGVILFGFLLMFGVFAWYAKDLPSPGKLSQSNSEASTVFYDRNGKVLYEMYKDKNRVPVSFTNISENLKKATISIEDKNFYKHGGLSQAGILRSVFNLMVTGHISGGGSTITQQLIKNVLLNSSQSFTRKIKEAILAVSVEKKYTKDQILEMYLNEAPYGGTYWGVGSASRGYFNKDPQNLNLLESAILAGLPQNPSAYSPYTGIDDAWRGRTKDVLRRMREDKYITREQEEKTLKDLEKYKFSSPKTNIVAPHFIFYVRDQIEKEYGTKLINQGVKVKTTLDYDLQKQAEKIVKDEIKSLKGYNVGNGAVVILDSKTGEVLAMVGSYDYNDDSFGKFNVTTALRQPGSAMKPITYAVAFEKGYTPATMLMDVKTAFPVTGETDYVPENYDGKFRGPVQLRFALGNSYNIHAVKLLAMIGIQDFLQKAYDMGLTALEPTQKNLNRFGLSLTLGGGETTLLDLTSAYTVFASKGEKRSTSSFTELTDFKGKTLYKAVRQNSKQVLSPEISFLISHILSDNNARIDAFGPTSFLRVPGKTVAVKTGTTNDKRDNWTVGYTNDITVGVWVGNNDNSPMNQKIASGTTGASSIWYKIMVDALKKYKDGIMDKPDKVKAVQIDSLLGGLPKDGSPTRSEFFIEGTEPKDVSPFYKKLKISKSNGKIANDIEVKNGNYEEKDYIVITEKDPVSTDGKNRWQEAIDAWISGQSDDRFKGPRDTSDASAEDVVLSIKEPSDHATVNSGSVKVRAKVTSVSNIKRVKIYANGGEKKSLDGDRKDVDETIDLSEGTYEIKVEATNEKDKTGTATIKIGVNKPWDYQAPTSAPTPTNTPVPTPLLTISP